MVALVQGFTLETRSAEPEASAEGESAKWPSKKGPSVPPKKGPAVPPKKGAAVPAKWSKRSQ